MTRNHAEIAQGKTNAPNLVKAVGESFDPRYRPTGQLETEDIVILILSIILIIATAWLATTVL